jgi:hypothetical protein
VASGTCEEVIDDSIVTWCNQLESNVQEVVNLLCLLIMYRYCERSETASHQRKNRPKLYPEFSPLVFMKYRYNDLGRHTDRPYNMANGQDAVFRSSKSYQSTTRENVYAMAQID